MGFFNKKPLGGGLMDVIRCDESSYLIWKWHPEGTEQGKNNKENTIRWGSSLRVKEGSVAVFVYSSPDGTNQDYIVGPFDQVLETKNLPVLSGIMGLAYHGSTPFQAEIYFINLTKIIQIKFGVPYFDVYDPRFLDYSVPVAVRGSISFRINSYKEFIYLHSLTNFSVEDFQVQIRDTITRYVKNIVSNAPLQNNIPVVQLERKIDLINELVEADIKDRFYKDFGVTVTGVDISAIEINKASDGYKQLKSVTQDLTTATMQAQNEVNIKEMRDSQKLKVFERAGRMFTDIKEDQYARHKKTQTDNFIAYQTEASEHVGVAGAKGLGKMNAQGAGGFNPMSMMAGMAVGSAMGKNIAGAMNKVTENPETPPPIPSNLAVKYHVAVAGKATGPYDLETLYRMFLHNSFCKDSLVWTKGMQQWKRAIEVDELTVIFDMPPIPEDDSVVPPIPQE